MHENVIFFLNTAEWLKWHFKNLYRNILLICSLYLFRAALYELPFVLPKDVIFIRAYGG
jgi:hypothetical protein